MDRPTAQASNGTKAIMKLGQSYIGYSSTIKNFSSIVCMNTTENKYYVYSLNGILQQRVNYTKQVQKYGKPLSASSDG